MRNLTHSGLCIGGSTLTQQLARDMYPDNRARPGAARSPRGRAGYKIEQTLSKDEILEIYMNQIWRGGRTYGFCAAAAQRYWQGAVRSWTWARWPVIGLPKNPAGYNPHIASAARRSSVKPWSLAAFGGRGPGHGEQADAAKAAPLHLRRVGRLSSIADHAMEQVRAEVVARYGPEAYERGLQVTTTLYAAEQEAAQQALRHAPFDPSAVSPTGARKAASSCPPKL